MRTLLFVVGIVAGLSSGIATAQQMKPGKGGAGGSGALSNSGGSRTPGDNVVQKGDRQRANNKQGGQQQHPPKGSNQ